MSSWEEKRWYALSSTSVRARFLRIFRASASTYNIRTELLDLQQKLWSREPTLLRQSVPGVLPLYQC